MEMAAMMKDMFPEGAPFPADGDGSMDISQILSMLGKQWRTEPIAAARFTNQRKRGVSWKKDRNGCPTLW